MMRYCGNCGARLDARALTTGRCPSCGAAISATGDALMPTFPTTLLGTSSIASAPWPGVPGTGTTRRVGGARRLMLVAGILLLVGALALTCLDIAIVAMAR